MDRFDVIPESFEKGAFAPVNQSLANTLHKQHGYFPSNVLPKDGVFLSDMSDAFAQIQRMYDGTMIDGQRTVGLKALSDYKINPDYATQNIKQQAGFAAEIISTMKENLQAIRDNTGIVTYRADDRPDLFPKNDQYVDKIRVDSNGTIVDRIQSKFVGGNGKECVSKLLSPKMDKYFIDGKVDKIEIPSDYFDDALQEITEKVSGLQKQLERVTLEGKTDVAEQLQQRIDRYNQLEGMLEKSVVSSEEAVSARQHPQRYTAKLAAKPTLEAGAKSGVTAAALTAAVSTVDNVRQCLNGEITPQEAVVDVAKDTGVAGGAAFVSTTIATAMQASSHKLICSIGKIGVPAAVISFGVQSFDSVVDFAQGEIDGKELARELGENAAAVGGGVVGGIALAAGVAAAAGVAVSALPVVTTIATGIVGGMVGCALASEAYATAVKVAPEIAEVLREKAQAAADGVADLVSNTIPDKLEDVKSAINGFAAENKLPIRL